MYRAFSIALFLTVSGWVTLSSMGAVAQLCQIDRQWRQQMLLYSPIPRAYSTPPPPQRPESRPPQPTEAELRQAIQANPGDATAYLKLINLLRKENRNAEIVTVAQQWIGQVPNSGRLPYRLLGDAFLAQNQLEPAIATYQKAIAVLPSAPEQQPWYDYLQPASFWIQIGDLRQLQGKVSEAIEAYTKGMQQNSSATLARGGVLGNQSMDVKRYGQRLDRQQAERVYQQLTQRVPRSAFGYVRLTELLLQQKRFDAAIALYRRWVPLAPQPPVKGDLPFSVQPPLYLAELLEKKASYLRQQGQLQASAATYRAGLKVDPANALLFQGFVEILVAQGNLEEAAQLYQQQIQRSPHWSQLYLELGAIRGCQGRFDQAITVYEQVARKGEKLPAYHFIGQLLERQGKLEQAAQAYGEVLAAHQQANSDLLPAGTYQQYQIFLQKQQWRQAIGLYQRLLQR